MDLLLNNNTYVCVILVTVMRNISLKMNEMVLQKKLDSNGLHCAMQLPLRIAQVFGFFPIYVGGSNYRSLKIKWLYWRMFYSFITIVTFALVTVGTIWRQIPEKKNILTIGKYYYCSFSGYLLKSFNGNTFKSGKNIFYSII